MYIYFSYVCSKRRLWVHVRTASSTIIYVLDQKKKKKTMYTPVYPSLTLQKFGLSGYTFHGHVFLVHSSCFCVHEYDSVHRFAVLLKYSSRLTKSQYDKTFTNKMPKEQLSLV